MSREGKEPIVKLLVTIMDRGKGERAVEFYRSRGLPYHFITLGFGTANSQILDYFGLSETEKDIVLTLVQEERALRLLQDTTAAFRMTGPGRGILFTLPLSGVSGRVPQILEYTAKEKEEAGMEEKQETAGEAEAVSYTHLDVYKRQILPSRPASWKKRCRTSACSTVPPSRDLSALRNRICTCIPIWTPS